MAICHGYLYDKDGAGISHPRTSKEGKMVKKENAQGIVKYKCAACLCDVYEDPRVPKAKRVVLYEFHQVRFFVFCDLDFQVVERFFQIINLNKKQELN